tara:strand:+ start:7358 stop:7804 length:447 start_codon:yes stop_codon:yes gene_type:complete
MELEINYFFEDIPKFKYGMPTKKWLKLCLSKEKKEAGVLNFIFCSDEYLRSLNIKYLKRAYLTDVIAFPHPEPDFLEIRSCSSISGDVFVSIERVKENKKKYNTIFAEELKRIMVHGCLHLIGFKDESKAEKKIMREKENTYIKLKTN